MSFEKKTSVIRNVLYNQNAIKSFSNKNEISDDWDNDVNSYKTHQFFSKKKGLKCGVSNFLKCQ